VSGKLRIYVPLALYGIFLMLPFVWMLLTAFKSDQELSQGLNPFWISHFTFYPIHQPAHANAYVQWFANTLFVSIAATVLSVFVSYITAYAIIRLRLPRVAGREYGDLSRLHRPAGDLVHPARVGDHPAALVRQALGAGPNLRDVPGAVLHLAADRVPQEHPARARRGGACRRREHLAILWRIIFPIAVPGLISATIFSFTLSWNEYLYALCSCPRRSTKPSRSA